MDFDFPKPQRICIQVGTQRLTFRGVVSLGGYENLTLRNTAGEIIARFPMALVAGWWVKRWI
jgi:hypothetical protein